MHVEGQRRGAAIAPHLGRGQTISLEIGAEPAVLFGNANTEQAFAVHVAKVLDWKTRVAIMLGGPRRQHAAAEAARMRDQIGLKLRETECVWREDRIVFAAVGGRAMHAAS